MKYLPLFSSMNFVKNKYKMHNIFNIQYEIVHEPDYIKDISAFGKSFIYLFDMNTYMPWNVSGPDACFIFLIFTTDRESIKL